MAHLRRSVSLVAANVSKCTECFLLPSSSAGSGSSSRRLSTTSRKGIGPPDVVDSSQNFAEILQQVQDGSLSASQATRIIATSLEKQTTTLARKKDDDDDPIRDFANLDLRRASRVGFPEAVFAEGKTAQQVAMILDRMAHAAAAARQSEEDDGNDRLPTPILATRVTEAMYREIQQYAFQNGSIHYYDQARIVAMRPIGGRPLHHDDDDQSPITKSGLQQQQQQQQQQRVVVVTAGTTDIAVAEEAAVTLELAGVPVDRVWDAGVAGLHRILHARPTLTAPDVYCVIVVAGMDGALPSVVGGLVPTPVIAVPTSIGYGASFGGVSALLTMLNSCSPGVGVVNIDNGFGAAALAYKMLVASHRLALLTKK